MRKSPVYWFVRITTTLVLLICCLYLLDTTLLLLGASKSSEIWAFAAFLLCYNVIERRIWAFLMFPHRFWVIQGSQSYLVKNHTLYTPHDRTVTLHLANAEKPERGEDVTVDLADIKGGLIPGGVYEKKDGTLSLQFGDLEAFKGNLAWEYATG